MAGKVRIKAGPVEFEYEGETELSLANIKDLFTHIETLFKVPVLAEGGQAHPIAGEKPPTGSNSAVHKLHVNSIAAKLDAKTGPELALAAAAYLQLNEDKETFSRAELLGAMKKAPKYYKKSMAGNLTPIINGLLNGKFNQTGEEQYSLTSDEHDALVAKLA